MSVIEHDNRPVWTLLTSHWLTMAGALIATVAAFAWLLTFTATQVRGHASNPYIGILSFIILPMAFVAGLVLMPIGIWISKREIRLGVKQALTRKTAVRRLAGFLIVATI